MGLATQEVLRSIFEDPQMGQQPSAPSLADRFASKFKEDALGAIPGYNSMFVPKVSGGGSIDYGRTSSGSASVDLPPQIVPGAPIVEGGTGGGAPSGPSSAAQRAPLNIGSRMRTKTMPTPGGMGTSMFRTVSGLMGGTQNQGSSGNIFLDGLADGSLTVNSDGHIVDQNGRPIGIIVNGVPMPLRR